MDRPAGTRLPQAGDVLHVTRAASVQFHRPIMFRVIRVQHDRHTYEGWLWLDGYELDRKGDAVERRSIFVQYGGLMWMNQAASGPTQRQPARQRKARSEPGRGRAGDGSTIGAS